MDKNVQKNQTELVKQGNKQTIGCLFFFILIAVAFIYFLNNTSSDSESSSSSSSVDVNPCLMSEDFIKQDLNYPKTANFPFLDCHSTDNGNQTFTVLRKISAKNAFGVEKDYIYKVEMRYKGGTAVDINNWELINIQSEESK